MRAVITKTRLTGRQNAIEAIKILADIYQGKVKSPFLKDVCILIGLSIDWGTRIITMETGVLLFGSQLH